jgi:hypothetical protein
MRLSVPSGFFLRLFFVFVIRAFQEAERAAAFDEFCAKVAGHN